MGKQYTYTYKKSTKATYVFEHPELGSYYLPQTFFNGKAPAKITVTIAE